MMRHFRAYVSILSSKIYFVGLCDTSLLAVWPLGRRYRFMSITELVITVLPSLVNELVPYQNHHYCPI